MDISEGVSEPATYASMLDSGSFVLRNSSGGIIWQSFDHPTDTLLTGQRLLAGKELPPGVSETNHSTGRFRLAMQQDGNLVQYPMDVVLTTTAYWSSITYLSGDNVSLNLDFGGHLYLLNSTGFNIMNITVGGYATKGIIYLMRVDWDGIFRLYSYNLTQNSTWSIVWQSTNDTCRPIGLCGLNSYCVSNPNQQPACRCLPGFASLDKEIWYSDCGRNFTAEICTNRQGTVEYNIEPVYDTVWEDVSYSVLSVTNREDCEQACLEDCKCEAALFNGDDQCRMQRLPLRFGRRESTTGSNNIAFVKVDSPVPSTDSRHLLRKKAIPIGMIIIVSSSFVAFMFVILASFCTVIYKYQTGYTRILDDGLYKDIAPKSFSYAEIESLTKGFKEEVGRGSSGTVYKGINCQKSVAVKRLEKVLAEEEREFLTEIRVIGRTHHRNLVRLLDYSCDGPKKILVYEYMSNGSLADLLFTPDKQLTWVERMSIARDIARGILYLHDECETQIIHCDIKPHNILMDESSCAKISDFGLSKLMKPEQTKTFTGVRGTRGYVAPEWHRNLPVTVKVDVYSFGVVLLEIICCRRSMDVNLPEDQIILEDWVYQCFEAGELSQLIGDEEVELKQLERVIKVALWCIIDEPSLRPSMKKVLLMLEGTIDIPMPPNPSSYLSCI